MKTFSLTNLLPTITCSAKGIFGCSAIITFPSTFTSHIRFTGSSDLSDPDVSHFTISEFQSVTSCLARTIRSGAILIMSSSVRIPITLLLSITGNFFIFLFTINLAASSTLSSGLIVISGELIMEDSFSLLGSMFFARSFVVKSLSVTIPTGELLSSTIIAYMFFSIISLTAFDIIVSLSSCKILPDIISFTSQTFIISPNLNK